MIFRALKADEIDVRVGTVSAKGASLLLYKDARVDMTILDETVGEMNWQRDHKEVKGNLYCGIGIYCKPLDEWVWKWDCGVESNTEKEKGEASDSFKRAGFNWGIGRELYTSPFIFIPTDTKPKANGKGYELEKPSMFFGIKVSEIDYVETEKQRVISKLTLIDKNGTIIFQMKENIDLAKKDYASDRDKAIFTATCSKAKQDPNEILMSIGWKRGERVTNEHLGLAYNKMKDEGLI